MDRRFLAWLCLTAALFMLWISLRQRFLPPAPDRPAVAQKDVAKVSPEINDPGRKSDPIDTKKSIGEVDDADFQSEKETGPQWFTLGSMDAKDGYRLLVTLSNRGASIQRVELIEQKKQGVFKYRVLERTHGYLGYLPLVSTPRGLSIGSVPAGSGAALATCTTPNIEPGLQVDDVLQMVDGMKIETQVQWDIAFANKKPGTSVQLVVQRNNETGESKTLTFESVLTEMPMDVVRVEDDTLFQEAPGNLLRNSLLTTLSSLDGVSLGIESNAMRGLENTLDGNWNSKVLELPVGMGIEFTMPIGGLLKKAGITANLELVKQYRLMPIASEAKDSKGYDIQMDVIVRNLDDQSHQVALRQQGFNGLTLEGWWYLTKISPHMFEGAGARDIVYASEGAGHKLISCRSIFKGATAGTNQSSTYFLSEDQPEARRKLKYIGLDAQFFAAAVMPHPDQPSVMTNITRAASTLIANPLKVNPAKINAANVGFWFDTPVRTIEAKSEQKQSYLLFAGPKDSDVLAAYGLDRCIEYGWFEWVAKPLSWILHGFYKISNNYGIAIVMLTVLVRGSMFPISRRAAVSAQRMQEIAPELKKIAEQYKEDWEKRSKATQEIYKKYKFNPMAGCLPVFFQIPIFIGLYRAVSIDIELRQQGLVPGIQWCSNLAGPDKLFEWSRWNWMPDVIVGMGTGWFGPFFNLLPILTVTLFVIQQKVLMPKPQDEQQQLQQTMMMYMTLFMGVLFFKVPAGLCIYFITSSIWSLVERNLVKRMTPPIKVNPADAVVAATSVSANPSKGYVAPKERQKPKGTKSPEKLSDVLPWLRRNMPEGKQDKPKRKRPGSN